MRAALHSLHPLFTKIWCESDCKNVTLITFTAVGMAVDCIPVFAGDENTTCSTFSLLDPHFPYCEGLAT